MDELGRDGSDFRGRLESARRVEEVDDGASVGRGVNVSGHEWRG